MKKLLNRNENLMPPAPKCLKILKQSKINELNQYALGYYNSILADELTKTYKFPRKQIIVGYGSEDLLRHIFDSLNPRVDKVLTHEFYYTFFNKYLAFRGINLHTFRMIETRNEFKFDIEDCINKCQKYKPKLLIITTPNNPTGNTISLTDLRRILGSVSKKTIVLIDEAYYGFDTEYDEQSFLSLVAQYPNIILARTFSKLFALAGLRIGYAFCGSDVKNIISYQDRYLGMNRIAEKVAIGALQSKQYYKKISLSFIKDRDLFISKVNELEHFKAFNSKANLVCIKADKKVLPHLMQKMDSAPFLVAKFISKNLLRVSLDPTGYTKKFIKILEKLDKNTV